MGKERAVLSTSSQTNLLSMSMHSIWTVFHQAQRCSLRTRSPSRFAGAQSVGCSRFSLAKIWQCDLHCNGSDLRSVLDGSNCHKRNARSSNFFYYAAVVVPTSLLAVALVNDGGNSMQLRFISLSSCLYSITSRLYLPVSKLLIWLAKVLIMLSALVEATRVFDLKTTAFDPRGTHLNFPICKLCRSRAGRRAISELTAEEVFYCDIVLFFEAIAFPSAQSALPDIPTLTLGNPTVLLSLNVGNQSLADGSTK